MFLLLLSLLLCVWGWGEVGGGVEGSKQPQIAVFLRIARGCNSGGKMYSIL